MEKLTKEKVEGLSEKELNALLKERFGLLIDRFRSGLSEGERREMVEKMMSIVDKTIEEVKVLEDLEKRLRLLLGNFALIFRMMK